MISYRFIAVTVALVFASYATLHWLLAVRPLMPNPNIPSFHRVGTSDDPRYNQQDAYESEGDDVRDSLRRVVQNTAGNLLRSPCNGYLRDEYIAAATNYARAWLSISSCQTTCNRSKERAQLELAQKAFNTPFDKTVRDLMRQVHDTDTIREGDFAPDVVEMVARMSGDYLISRTADPAVRKNLKEFRTPLACRS